MHDPDSRRFDGPETERILRRAVEIEESATPAVFRLSELREIAADVGVSPASVERAANELAPMPASRLTWLAGGPTSFRLDDGLPGEIGAHDASRLVEVIETALGRTGRLEQGREGLVWRASDPYGSVVVGFGPSPEGGNRIRIIADRAGAAQMTWILSGVGALLTAIAVQNHVPGLGTVELIGLWSASALSGGAVARGIWSRIALGWKGRLAGLLGRVRRSNPAPEADEPE
jgi:hypothetical protein